MTAKEAQDIVYKLLGQHLNDIQQKVFTYSWEGHSYGEIAEDCDYDANYIRQVGSDLWRALSKVLGEPVTKHNIQVIIHKYTHGNSTLATKVLLSYCNQKLALNLAKEVEQVLTDMGCIVPSSSADYMLRPEQRRLLAESDWLQHINTELEQCDYLIVLMSSQALANEMITETVRRARLLQNEDSGYQPSIILIRVALPPKFQLSYDLQSYLESVQVVYDWRSPTDTPQLLQDLHDLLSQDQESLIKTISDSEITTKAEVTEELIDNLEIDFSLISIPYLPLPVAAPEFPGGQVPLDSRFYIERLYADPRCFEMVTQPGGLVRIKAPRQMGKTSLMARVLHYARSQEASTATLSFQLADSTIFSNTNRFLQWFCANVGRSLGIPNRIEDYWDDIFGSNYNSTDYFENYLLAEIDRPLVLGLDEIDRVFQYPEIASDFFGMLRAWYEKARYGDKSSDHWQKLRLIVVHSTEVYIPLNLNQSPFNVGLSIELLEFNTDQVSELAHRHGLDWHDRQVETLMNLVGGHPYLVRLVLYHIARQDISLSQLLQTATLENSIYGDHLRRHLWQLKQYPELITAFKQVVSANSAIEIDPIQAFKLQSMGLVKFQVHRVKPFCNLYRQYFSDRLK